MRDRASRTWKSPRDDAKEYSNVIVVNWMSEYSALVRTESGGVNIAIHVSLHVLETREASDESSPTFSDHFEHAINLWILACERSCDRRFGL